MKPYHLIRTLIRLNAQNIICLWLLIEFEKLTRLKAKICDKKRLSAICTVFLITYHAWSKLIVTFHVFHELKLTDWLIWLLFTVTRNTYIAEPVEVLLSSQTFFWGSDCSQCTFGLRPKLRITPPTYNRTAQNNNGKWKHCFWSIISNNTHLWNKVNPALPSPPNFCQYVFKRRPLRFRDCDRKPSQTVFAKAHLFIESYE